MQNCITIPVEKVAPIAELLLVAAKSPSVNFEGMKFAMDVIAEFQAQAAAQKNDNGAQ